jgi:opacity protein-like surface antigen
MWKIALTAVVATVILPSAVMAQTTPSGIYFEGRGGAVFLMDSDVDAGIPGVDLEATLDTGWMGEGAIGYAHESGFRGEVAAGYRKNDIDKLNIDVAGGGSGSVAVDGDVTATTVMANGYFDAYFGPQMRWAVYIGGGVGAAYLDVSSDLGSADDTVFAYQGSLGFSFAATPNVVLSLGYQYLATSDPEFEGIDAEYQSHNAVAGARFLF